MPIKRCPYCLLDIVVPSNKVTLREHIMEKHPEEGGKMDERQDDKKRVCMVKWRCLRCEDQFDDLDLYRAHYARKH